MSNKYRPFAYLVTAVILTTCLAAWFPTTDLAETLRSLIHEEAE